MASILLLWNYTLTNIYVVIETEDREWGPGNYKFKQSGPGKVSLRAKPKRGEVVSYHDIWG